MITPEMKAAGWRPMPAEDVRRKWEAQGGCWQAWTGSDMTQPTILHSARSNTTLEYARPVYPSTWDHAAWMWSVCTGESLEPTVEQVEANAALGIRHYYWHRFNDTVSWAPIAVDVYPLDGTPTVMGTLFLCGIPQAYPVTDLGQWGGLCLGRPPGCER